MNSLNLSRDGAGTASAPASIDPANVGTVRNWAGRALPAEVSLEPAAAIVAELRGADPAVAERLKRALDQFPPVGGEIAGFHLVAVLGRGTFGRVYLARQGELAQRFVALKVSTDLAGESQTLAQLQHTNIVPIYSVHRATPFQAVCMPFFGVTTLAHLLRRFRGTTALPASGRQLVDTLKVISGETAIPALGPQTGTGTGPGSLGPGTGPAAGGEPGERLSLARRPDRAWGPLDQLREASYPDAICWIGARLADGLAHAHAQGILHNDLKPANVLLTDEGQPMLLDFGVSEDLKLRTAAPGAPVGGTLPYMSPEHLRSVRDHVPATDTRSDVYALGIILFEMLTATHPFRLPTDKFDEELPRMIAERSAQPPRLRAINPAVPAGLEAIVRKCLDPDPARRYQSAAELRDELDRQRTNLPLRLTRVPSVRERLRKWANRHPHLTSTLSLGTMAALALAMCLIGLYARGVRLERYEAQAQLAPFDDDVRAAHYLLSTRAPEFTTVEDGVARAEAALARYGLPDDDQWERRPAFSALPPDDQAAVRARLAEACLLLARGYSLRGTPGTADALRMNELAGRLAGDDGPRALWDQRAELLRRLGRGEEAEHAAARARRTPLTSARDHYLSGTESLANGRPREALQLLRRSAELDPGYFWAHMALGQCHEALGQFTDAVACYTTAVALWPQYHAGYHVRGLARLRLRDFTRAKADLDRAEELLSLSADRYARADIYLNRSLAHQGLQDYPAGLRDLDRAIELGAPRTRAVFMRTRLRELAGDKDGAKKDRDEGLREEPTDDLGWVARGVAHVNTDPAAAIADFDAALRLNPRSLVAMQNKAHVLSKLNRNEEAVAALDRLLEIYPDHVQAIAGRGVLHARLGNEAAAVADAKAALQRDSSPVNTFQVAGIYALLDKANPAYRTEAIRLLTVALRGGFGHDVIETDRDLDPIRTVPEFKKLVDAARTMRSDSRR